MDLVRRDTEGLVDVTHEAAELTLDRRSGRTERAEARRALARELSGCIDVRRQVIGFHELAWHTQQRLHQRACHAAAVAAHVAVPQRHAVLACQNRLQKCAVPRDAGVLQQQVGIEQLHKLRGVGIIRFAFQPSPLPSRLLLRDADGLRRQNIGVQEARTGKPVHGVGQLGELIVVAQINDELQVIVLTQTDQVGLGTEAERTGAQEQPALDQTTVRSR